MISAADKRIVATLRVSCMLTVIISFITMRTPVLWVGFMQMYIGAFIIFSAVGENKFYSHVVRIQTDHKVVETGPYAIVRHPQYIGCIIALTGLTIFLHSWMGLAFSTLPIVILIYRLNCEEVFLIMYVNGYLDYTRRVRYKLVPKVY